MNIALICAALPPRLDGIGDYTVRLATALAETQSVTVLTAQEEPDPIPGVQIQTCFDKNQPRSYWNILKSVQSLQPDWVVLQYNPFSYGKWGRNLVLPSVMRQIKRRCHATKVAVMFHETYVPVIGFRFAIMATWQRWQFRKLGNNADALFFSIDPWVKRYRGLFASKTLYHLPVGSNIPNVGATRQEARARLGIPDSSLVVGVFGQAHIARLTRLIDAASAKIKASGKDVTLLYIGPVGNTAPKSRPGITVIATGKLEAEQVSRCLPAIDIFLSSFIEGVSTRRGSMMAGLQHGLAVVGTSGIQTGDMLLAQDGRAFLLSPWNSERKFAQSALNLATDEPLRNKLGAEAKKLYEQTFDWSKTAERLLDALNENREKGS